MLNIQEIKEAIDNVKSTGLVCVLTREQLYLLVDLAQLVVGCSEMMPEKKIDGEGKKCKCGSYSISDCGCNISWYPDYAYNQAIDDCTIRLTKKMVGLEEVIEDYYREAHANNETIKLKSYHVSDIADAIRKHMIGDESD